MDDASPPDGHEHAPGDSGLARRGVEALRGPGDGTGSRFAIVVSRFNGAITTRLFEGAVDVLLDAGATSNHIAAVQVPGAMELPLAAAELADTNHYHGIIALGCVIRGETPHFDYVCRAATDGLLQAQLDSGIPIGFGLVTAESAGQASDRSAPTGQGRNVGADAARAVLEMVGLTRLIRSG